MKNIVFQPAIPQDYQSISQLITTVNELYFISPKSYFPWTVEQVKTIAESRQFNTVGVDTDTKQIVAFANMYNLTEKTAFIGNVIVHQDYRCQNVGEKLMKYMIGICKKQKITPQVSVFNHNTGALRFYHRLGFIPFAMEQREYGEEKIMLIHCQLK